VMRAIESDDRSNHSGTKKGSARERGPQAQSLLGGAASMGNRESAKHSTSGRVVLRRPARRKPSAIAPSVPRVVDQQVASRRMREAVIWARTKSPAQVVRFVIGWRWDHGRDWADRLLQQAQARQPSISSLTGAQAADFSDPESQRTLSSAALAVAYELGREAAREYLAELNAHQGSAP